MMWVFIGALFEMRQRLKEDYEDAITFLMLLGIDILKKTRMENNNYLYDLYFYQFYTCEMETNSNTTFTHFKNISSILPIIFVQHIQEMGIAAFKATLKCQPCSTQ